MTSDRLFVPPGPQVTPVEAAARREANTAAQFALLDAAVDTTERARCPVCAGDHPDPCGKGEALHLVV